MEVEVAGDWMEVWQENYLHNFAALKEYFTGRNTKLHQRERIRVRVRYCFRPLMHAGRDWRRKRTQWMRAGVDWLSRLAAGTQKGMQERVMNLALIPLDGNKSRLINYSNAKAYTYTNIMAVGFHLPLSRFGFLSIHIPIFIYLQ